MNDRKDSPMNDPAMYNPTTYIGYIQSLADREVYNDLADVIKGRLLDEPGPMSGPWLGPSEYGPVDAVRKAYLGLSSEVGRFRFRSVIVDLLIDASTKAIAIREDDDVDPAADSGHDRYLGYLGQLVGWLDLHEEPALGNKLRHVLAGQWMCGLGVPPDTLDRLSTARMWLAPYLIGMWSVLYPHDQMADRFVCEYLRASGVGLVNYYAVWGEHIDLRGVYIVRLYGIILRALFRHYQQGAEELVAATLAADMYEGNSLRQELSKTLRLMEKLHVTRSPMPAAGLEIIGSAKP